MLATRVLPPSRKCRHQGDRQGRITHCAQDVKGRLCYGPLCRLVPEIKVASHNLLKTEFRNASRRSLARLGIRPALPQTTPLQVAELMAQELKRDGDWQKQTVRNFKEVAQLCP